MKPLIFKWIFILPLLLVSQLSSSSENCDLHAESVFTLTSTGLRERTLSTEDVGFMISIPGEIQNPYLRKPKDINTLAFRQKLTANLDKLQPSAIDELQAKLRAVLDASIQTKTLITKAKEKTSAIFAPKKLSWPQLESVKADPFPPFWHKGKEGELQLGIYDGEAQTLKLFSPARRETIIQRELTFDPSISNTQKSNGKLAVHSTPNGNLFLAHLYRGLSVTFVHNLELDQSFSSPVPEGTSDIRIVQGPNGKVYLIAIGELNVTTFRIERNRLEEIHSFQTKSFKIDNLEIHNSSEGHILITFVQSRTKLHILEPLKKRDRTYTPHLADVSLESAKSLLKPDGSYAVAVETYQLQSQKKHLHILTSSDPNVFTVTNFPLFTGEYSFNLSADGSVYLAVAFETQDHTDANAAFEAHNSVAIFRLPPIRRPTPIELLQQWMWVKTKEIQPTFISHGEIGWGRTPRWMNTADGITLFIRVAQDRSQNIYFSVYDFANMLTPLTQAKIENEHYDNLVQIFTDRNLIYAHFPSEGAKTRFYQIQADTRPVFSNDKFFSNGSFGVDRDGAQYMLGITSGASQKHISVYEVFDRDESP